MIIMGIIDYISTWLAGLIGLIPPLPAEWANQIDTMTDGGYYIGSLVAKFGPFVPFDTISSLISVWVGLLAFWAAMLGVRLVLWILGR